MSLAGRQEDLVRALVGGAATPPGFTERDLTAARSALMRKRSGEVGQVWPRLAEAYGARWQEAFSVWAAQRPPLGSLRDGWDFARDCPPTTPQARLELTICEVTWRYDGQTAPRKRRLPAVRILRAAGRPTAVVQAAGRVRVIVIPPAR